MIHFKDTKSVNRPRNPQIPALIRSKTAFENEHHNMYAFTDQAGVYAVYSYNNPVYMAYPDGRFDITTGYIYAGHRALIESALEKEVQNA